MRDETTVDDCCGCDVLFSMPWAITFVLGSVQSDVHLREHLFLLTFERKERWNREYAELHFCEGVE